MEPRLMNSFFEGDMIKNLFPKGYDLLAGTNQIYELELALGEVEKLTKKEEGLREKTLRLVGFLKQMVYIEDRAIPR